MSITKTTAPQHSSLFDAGQKYDYLDSYQGQIIDTNNELKAFDIGKAFFTSSPEWIGILFSIRNKLVGLIGLKTSGEITDRQQLLANFRGEPGEQMGLFKVFSKSEQEVIIGEDDKHLNFRVSLFISPSDPDQFQRAITITTTVQFNNWFGKLYFLPVRPFHQLIVPAILKAIIKKLDNK